MAGDPKNAKPSTPVVVCRFLSSGAGVLQPGFTMDSENLVRSRFFLSLTIDRKTLKKIILSGQGFRNPL